MMANHTEIEYYEYVKDQDGNVIRGRCNPIYIKEEDRILCVIRSLDSMHEAIENIIDRLNKLEQK